MCYVGGLAMVVVCSKCNAKLEIDFERRGEWYMKPCDSCKAA